MCEYSNSRVGDEFIYCAGCRRHCCCCCDRAVCVYSKFSCSLLLSVIQLVCTKLVRQFFFCIQFKSRSQTHTPTPTHFSAFCMEWNFDLSLALSLHSISMHRFLIILIRPIQYRRPHTQTPNSILLNKKQFQTKLYAHSSRE